jgi:sec-independent protein translocase protein TatA
MIGSAVDWIILVVVALLVLGGAKKIPEWARSMGRARGEFEKGKKEIEKELEQMGK